MSAQADDITSYSSDRKSILDYIFIVGSWLVSCISLVVIGLIAYWAIKIPEKNINNLPIINAMQGEIRIEPDEPGVKSFHDEGLSIYKNLENGSKILDKNNIILNKVDENSDSNVEKAIDLGYVGEPEKIDPQVIHALINEKMIPVIAPVGIGTDGLTYNINADTAAGSISAAMKASRMIMLTDVAGVLDQNGKLIQELTISEAQELIKNKIVVGGMIPKIKTCIDAVLGGAEASVIMD